MVQANQIGSESDSDNEISSISSKPKRFGVLVSSDDDEVNEDASTAEVSECMKKKIDPVSLNDNKTVNNFNSDDDAQDQNEEVVKSVKQKPRNNNRFKFKLLSASDIESDNESECEDDLKGKSVDAAAVNVKSSDAESNDEDEETCLVTVYSSEDNIAKISEKPKKKKASVKIDKKLQIRSETQRMEREMSVNLPYHRPKQRTLREFLSRKKNHLKADALRLTTGNMIHTWEAIDKSIKETADFFKIESEDDNSNEPPAILKCTEESENLENDPNHLTNSVVDNNLCADAFLEKTETRDLIHDNDSDMIVPQSPTAEMEVKSNLEQNEKLIAAENIAEIDDVMSHAKTESWLKDVAAFEKRENLRNKLQLSPSVLDKVPTLTNDAFVDLDNSDSESGELQPGAKLLMDRLLKFQKPIAKLPTSLKTTVAELDETGHVKNVSIEVVPFTESKPIIPDGLKPGAKLQKFRENLRNEIEAKWEVEYKKRCPENPVKPDFEENVESDEELAYDGESDESSSGDEESEPEEEDVVVKEKPRRFCEFGNSEAEESEGDEEVDDNNDDQLSDKSDSSFDKKGSDKEPEKNESEELDCSLLPAFQPGGGLLMGGSTLTQQSQPLPLHGYSPASSPVVMKNSNLHTPLLASQRDEKQNETPHSPRNSEELLDVNSVKKNLFGGDENSNEDADDPFLFVSGAFPETAPAAAPSQSHEPLPTQSKLKRIIMMEDSDQENDDENSEDKLIVGDETHNTGGTDNEHDLNKPDAKPPARKAAQLVFSDESDDDDRLENNNSEAEDSEEEKDDDVEYDSEENEVVKVRPGEFFDQEAELSESEWSGDEDEKGLDLLEAEAGDADVLDEEQVASQLGRIHMRRVLDEDARDVRLLQELLLEDGDLHTDGKARDRKFRWKNLTAGFDLSSEHKDEVGSDGEIDPADAELAKHRFEKTQFIMKLQQEGKYDNIEEECSGKENSVLALGKQLLQRMSSAPQASSTTSASKRVFARGSFLSKDENFFNRLSRITTGGNDGPLGPSSSKNFVFAVQEKEVEVEEINNEGLKRKAISCHETVKRAKYTFKNQPSLFDKLHIELHKDEDSKV